MASSVRTQLPRRPGPWDLAACLSLFCPPLFSPLVTEKPNLLGSALRPLLPSPTNQPTLFQGIRDLFYLQSLKKPVAKVTGARTAGSLPWGRGFAPKQLSVGAVPAGTRAFASSVRTQLSGEQIPFCCTHPQTPPSPPQVSTGYFPWGQPASQLKKCSNNKQQKKCPPTHAHTL